MRRGGGDWEGGKGGFAGVDSRVRNNERTKEQVYEAPTTTTITTVTATEWGGRWMGLPLCEDECYLIHAVGVRCLRHHVF